MTKSQIADYYLALLIPAKIEKAGYRDYQITLGYDVFNPLTGKPTDNLVIPKQKGDKYNTGETILVRLTNFPTSDKGHIEGKIVGTIPKGQYDSLKTLAPFFSLKDLEINKETQSELDSLKAALRETENGKRWLDLLGNTSISDGLVAFDVNQALLNITAAAYPDNVDDEPKKDIDHAILQVLMATLTAAVTGQMVLLSGPTGAGKTSMVQHLSGCLNGRHRLIAVRPAWLEAQDLLGYYNADLQQYQSTPFLDALIEAGHHQDEPFFLTLDEMNLSRIENYGADLLALLEQAYRGDGGDLRLYAESIASRGNQTSEPVPPVLPLPKNLLLFGTLNMDETTHSLSPKVLDRSLVIRVPPYPFSKLDFAPKLPVKWPKEPRFQLQQLAELAREPDTDLKTEVEKHWGVIQAWYSSTGRTEGALLRLGLYPSRRLQQTFQVYLSLASHSVDKDMISKVTDAFISSKILPWISFSRDDEVMVGHLSDWLQRGNLKRYPRSSAIVQELLDGSGEDIQYLA